MKLHEKRRKIILLTIISIAFIAVALLLLPSRFDDSHSLSINPDEIYRISWWSHDGAGGVGGEAVDRDKIEEIVTHLNAWAIIHQIPRLSPCSCSLSMHIHLVAEDGSKSISVYGRYIIWSGYDGFHRVICHRRPAARFARMFE